MIDFNRMIDFNKISEEQKNEPVSVADFLICITSIATDEMMFFEGVDGQQVVPVFECIAAAESFLAVAKGSFGEDSQVAGVRTLDFVDGVVNPASGRVFKYSFQPETLENFESFTAAEIVCLLINAAYDNGVDGVKRIVPLENEPDPEGN